MCPSFAPAHPPPPLLLQAAQQVKLPRWLEAFLRLPGAGIVLMIVFIPITLVGGCCLHAFV